MTSPIISTSGSSSSSTSTDISGHLRASSSATVTVLPEDELIEETYTAEEQKDGDGDEWYDCDDGTSCLEDLEEVSKAYQEHIEHEMSRCFRSLEEFVGTFRWDESVIRDPRPTERNDDIEIELQVLESEAYEDIYMAEESNGQEEFFQDCFEVALDSGAGDHVARRKAAPNYKVVESAGNRAGQHFVTAGNTRIPNQGQFTLALRTGESDRVKNKEIRSTFQVADVTRPLWSVGRICDEGFAVTFDKNEALVKDAKGQVVCRFERRGGLYVSKLSLRNLAFKKGFRRQGAKA